jgi:hypothetical protein
LPANEKLFFTSRRSSAFDPSLKFTNYRASLGRECGKVRLAGA